MASKPVALLLADLGVTKFHSRPHVSNDNPYSESQFKTLKYRPEFPKCFGTIEDARKFTQRFFKWYNDEHRHSSIGYYTPADVHCRRAEAIQKQRAVVLDAAYQAHSERFVRKPPTLSPLVLTDEERETLERWARRPKSAQSLALRCRIVLAAATGATNVEVADRVGVHPATASKWRSRFVERRFDGLSDDPRPGAPRTITDDDVERVIVKTLEETPTDATHWSTRSMAKATGISQTAVSRIWRAFGLKPHLVDDFKLSPVPQFIDKVRDVVGMYLNPPEAAVVLCVDDKTQIQALDRTPPILPLMPGVPQRQTHDYKRNGTTNLYAALDVASGHVITNMTSRHRAAEFKKFLNLINRTVPQHLDVHIVLDNVSTHKTPEIQRWLQRHPRFTFHFTPTYSSWMNLVERWFAELTNKWLTRGTHHSVRDLTVSIRTWADNWNNEPKPFVWHKTADEILDTLAAYCHRISDSEH